ncbi:hypothetical protein PaeBR_15220 [Paenibacillus sp. BR2-3]|uniref:hypothetical protein n=1 Tax=Paenibacillus sp. BR2-3 TaxID=3048494 RepID=UPI003977E3A2
MVVKYIQDLQKEIEKQEHIIQLIESYSPETLEQKIILEYAIEESVKNVADKINAEGHRIGERKYISNDITAVIIQKPILDELHEIVKKSFEHNKKGMSRYL